MVFQLVDFRKKEASDANQEKSLADFQTEERNSKRRRINYKQAKKVHTSGKTHTEVFFLCVFLRVLSEAILSCRL
jgi:hypothetical protein